MQMELIEWSNEKRGDSIVLDLICSERIALQDILQATNRNFRTKNKMNVVQIVNIQPLEPEPIGPTGTKIPDFITSPYTRKKNNENHCT